MKTNWQGEACSATQSGKATGSEEGLQGGGGVGGSLPEPVLSTHNVQVRRMGRSRAAKILGSCHVGPSLVSSLAGTCSPGGQSCASP